MEEQSDTSAKDETFVTRDWLRERWDVTTPTIISMEELGILHAVRLIDGGTLRYAFSEILKIERDGRQKPPVKRATLAKA